MPTDTWICPAGVTFIFAEGWGSGSDGGGTGLGTGASGGGGSYARSARFAVTPGNPYGVQWGPGGTNVTTLFDVGGDMKAVPCVASSVGADGVTNNVGAVKTNGGDGLLGQFDGGAPADTLFASRGGGSSGGRNSNGTNASGPSGAAVAGGGTGGDGGDPQIAGHPDGSNPNCIGTNGVAAGPGPGGGGGGVGWNIFCAGLTGGAGGEGGILIYNATNDPVFYAVPSLVIGQFGSIPSFPAPPYPPKSVPRAFVM